MTSNYNKGRKLLFLVFVFFFFCASSSSPIYSNTTNLKSIRDYLQTINKPAVKTIKSPDGDLIDCVLFHLQSAFDHPLLRGHKTMKGLPQISKDHVNDTLEEFSQVWRMSGESCPENTIPVRRTTEEDVLRAGSVEAFIGRKQDLDDYTHYYAIGTSYGTYYGVDASFTVWKPIVQKGERSISQMWIMSGTRTEGNLNSLETGYQVGYPDSNPRLFVYWTGDAYTNTGCYNLECPGFIHTSRKIALGSAIQPVSQYGKIHHIRLRVQKSLSDGNWWLKFGDEPVGYWPVKLFPLLHQAAELLELGGEVISKGGRTTTQMGSGDFPKAGFQGAGLIGHISGMDMGHTLQKIHKLDPIVTNSKCYDAELHSPKEETYMYYGGPGCH